MDLIFREIFIQRDESRENVEFLDYVRNLFYFIQRIHRCVH